MKRNLRTAVRICSGLLYIYCILGPAFMISIGILSNLPKFLINKVASLLADSIYFCLSDHVLIGSRIWSGTPGHEIGISTLNISCLVKETFSKSPLTAAFTMDLV